MFQNIRTRRAKLNKFNLSHDVKLSFNMGDLIPVLVEEVVPGDRFRVQSEIMLRFAPMLAPIMHRVNVWTHYFFVPNRLVWNEWEEFITGGEDGTSQPVHPVFTTSQLISNSAGGNGSLADYLGLPTLNSNVVSESVNALPFRAYSLIWNEWYRDQNLQTPIDVTMTSGLDNNFDQVRVQKRCWEKDYLTSCLPWAQRGDAVSVPGSVNYSTFSTGYRGDTGAVLGDMQIAGAVNPTAPGTLYINNPPPSLPDPYIRIENIEDLEVDINDLRRSNALQKWLELAARGGSRYVEQVKAFFGVTSSDARLQRPEFLGGGRQNVMISEVLQTGETATTPQGNMSGHGISVGATNRFNQRFEEHGFVFGIVSVLPKTAYQQGIKRMWSRDDKFDYYFPQFAHLGEQEVLNKEVSFDGNTTNDPDGVFGYQSRYAEYKHSCSRVHGDFRETLDYWHLGRIFPSGTINLNSDFVASDPSHRIFANTTPTDHKLWAQIYHKFDALRPMPYYADPRL
jgi:hypothetical protein